jgi:hypothetical protein
LKVRWRLGKARARPETHPPNCVWVAHSRAEQNAAAKWGTAAQVQQPDFLPKVSRRGHRHGRHGAHHHRAHHEKLERRAPNHPPKARTDLGIHSFSFRLATQWNSLHAELKSCAAFHLPKLCWAYVMSLV